MPVRRIFIARGGEHTASGREIEDDDTSATGLPRDPGLTPNGIRQAGELAVKLLEELPNALVIYSSPAFRCLETAAAVAEGLSNPVVFAEAGLACWYIAAGEHPSRAAAAHLPRLFPRCQIDVHSPLMEPSRGGESIGDLHHRLERMIRRLLRRVEREAGLRQIDVLLCTHAPCAITLARILSGDDHLHLCLGLGSLTVLERTDVDTKNPFRGWRLRQTGDTSYLSEGLQYPWFLCLSSDHDSPGVLQRSVDSL